MIVDPEVDPPVVEAAKASLGADPEERGRLLSPAVASGVPSATPCRYA